MNFLDTNVIVHSFLVPKRQLAPSELNIKENARKILKKIDEGEKVITSTVHLSECINILETHHSEEESRDIINSLVQHPNVKIMPVEKKDYVAALFLSEELNKKINDCLALALMKRLGITQIYSFDRDFDGIAGIKRNI